VRTFSFVVIALVVFVNFTAYSVFLGEIRRFFVGKEAQGVIDEKF